MKSLIFKSVVSLFVLTALSASPVLSGDVILPDTNKLKEYPYLVVTPPKPIAGEDTVNIQVMLGEASNQCWAPTYTDLKHMIEMSPLTIYPPLYIVKIWYKEIPVPRDRNCITLYDPVDYGPTYTLGVLKFGNYNVVNGDDPQVVYGSFSVSESLSTGPFTIKGTVYDDPYPAKRMSQPIPKAKIVITAKALPLSDESINVKSKDSTYTNEKGEYLFTGLSKGIYEMVCSHPDYRSVSCRISLSSDTIKNFVLVSKDAYASLTGTVTIISSFKDELAPIPVEGCTVVVSKNDPNSSAFKSDTNILKTLTDKNGRYLFEKIPITANGEIWFVKAYIKNYSGIAKVQLYNMRTDTVNFTFQEEYENKDSIIVNGVIFKTAASKFIYTRKEPVRIRYSITNTTNDTVTFGPFSAGCEYDLIVKCIEGDNTFDAESPIIYKASQHLVCLDMIKYLKVAPGQTITKDFPDWYFNEDYETANILPRRYIVLRFYAKLNGEEYNYTAVGVNVKIDLTPVSTTQKIEKVIDNIKVEKDAISLNIIKAQTISVTYYDLKGKVIPQLSFVKNVSAGKTLISIGNKNLSKGLYIVKIKGTDFEKRVNTLLLGK
ncbi:MAG: hypothetical protein N2053_05780 [Chitinispirillaceae bacterium]|nr:hypothetical protein [Chitinispirillaceae bacterium]